jgi:subtilase-type serine protease
VVGNFDTNLATGRAFVYDIDNNSWVELVKPGAVSITAYGIWYNGGTQYTIAGGYSNANLSGIDHGYLVNWDSATQTPSDWTSYDYNNSRIGIAISHFNGITGDGRGGFYLTGDWVGVLPPEVGAFFAHVFRVPGRSFSIAQWTQIAYPSAQVTSGNTVFENNVLGVYTVSGSSVVNGYVATVRRR